MTGRSIYSVLAAAALVWPAAAGSYDDGPIALPDHSGVPIVYLEDLTSGQILVAKHEDRRFMPASITKVMTLFVAFEMIEAGELSTGQRFTISDAAFKEWNRKGSTMFIPASASVAVDNLLRGIAAVSANDGSIVLAEGAAGSVDAWVEQMNEKARELGMRNTHFGTPNGWMDEGRTFTTAEDLAKLGRAMVTRHPGLYAEYAGLPGYRFNGIAQDNHNPILGVVEGADGIKTGFTNQSGTGFLGSAERGGRRLMMVVAGAERQSRRDALSRELLEWGFAAHDTTALFEPGRTVARAMVQDGSHSEVALKAGGPVTATFPRSDRGEVTLTLRYDGPLRAPIKAGERVAELEIRAGDMPPSRVPLYAAHEVGQANAMQRFMNGLTGLFR